jgi:hypothetical protein
MVSSARASSPLTTSGGVVVGTFMARSLAATYRRTTNERRGITEVRTEMGGE